MPTVKVVEGTDRKEFEREVARTVEEIGAAGAKSWEVQFCPRVLRDRDDGVTVYCAMVLGS